MEFIEEVVVEEFLPTVRSMLAERLREEGLTQREVAELLGISQSAVSKYAHGQVAGNDAIRSHPRVRSIVDQLADELAAGDTGRVRALVELEVLIRNLEVGGVLADLHEERMPALAEHEDIAAQIHDPESNLRVTERTLAALRRGLRILETTSGFAGLIPQVGANLVACLPEATELDDVAGVPGRILDVKGQATVPGEPEFGVSEHVASILLAARRGGSDATAAINIRYTDSLLSTLTDADYTAVEFAATADTDSKQAVEEAVATTPDADVIYQTGGFGIEPLIYVLGSDPEAVADTVRQLC
ncbi:MAG: thiamine-phosphate synthase family protein [Salinarchaeum sp.]